MESRQKSTDQNAKDRVRKATRNQGEIITEGKRQKARWNRGKIIQKAKTKYGIEARQLQNAKVNSSEFRITF